MLNQGSVGGEAIKTGLEWSEPSIQWISELIEALQQGAAVLREVACRSRSSVHDQDLGLNFIPIYPLQASA